MICPILSMGQTIKVGCEFDNCALWDDKREQCSLKSVVTIMEDVHDEIDTFFSGVLEYLREEEGETDETG